MMEDESMQPAPSMSGLGATPSSSHATTLSPSTATTIATTQQPNPLHGAFRTLIHVLHPQPEVGRQDADRLDQQLGDDLHGWCMQVIQMVTQLAPAVRKTGAQTAAASATGLQQSHAHLVLQYLTSMLHLFHMQPQLIQQEQQLQLQSEEEQFSSHGHIHLSSSATTSRPLLPFLYAHLFKYCLNLQEYDSYYHLFVHMPESFQTTQTTTAPTENMKLEYLKRFLIELLREQRANEIITRYNWNFSWTPADSTNQLTANTPSTQERTVREEVEEMLWWHAKSSDIQDEISATTNATTGTNTRMVGHYETLYSFLFTSHRYIRAAQSALHYFYRLESEVQASGGLHQFITRRVNQAQKGRGRAQTHTPGKITHTHTEQSIADTNELTLNLLRALLSRKLWALRSVENALEHAAPGDEATVFMVEDSGDRSFLEAKTKEAAENDETNSPLHKRSRATNGGEMDLDEDFQDARVGLGRIELLSRSALVRRLELLISQFDLADAMATGPVGVLLPPLQDVVEFPANIRAFIQTLIKFGLVDRAIHFVQTVFGEIKKTKDQTNPRQDEYETLLLDVFQLFTERLVRLTRAISKDDDMSSVGASDEYEYPLRMEDTLQALQLTGQGFTFGALTAASGDEKSLASLQLRQAEAVMQYLLKQHDTYSLRASEMVATEYLRAGLEIPLWLQSIYTAFMQSPVDEVDEPVSAFRSHAQAPPSTHAATLQSFPFLAFLRLLLSYNQFELLYRMSMEYLSWLARVSSSSTSSAQQTRDLSRSTMVDILDGFLFLQTEASHLRTPEAKEIQTQIHQWISAIKQKLAQLGTKSSGRVTDGSQQRLLMDPRAKFTPTTPATAFGSSNSTALGGFNSRLAPTPAAATAASSRFSLQPTPSAVTNPFTSSFAPSVPATSTPSLTPFSSFAPPSSSTTTFPSVSPFANDFSAAATPSKSKTGALAAAPTSSFSLGGFGAAATTAPSTPASTFNFGANPTPATGTKTPASSTANLIFQSAFANSNPATTTTPFSFGGFK